MAALPPYELSDHTADIVLTARGGSLPELFENAARGLLSAVGELRVAGDPGELSIELDADDRADLLHDFLSEVLFLFETPHWVMTGATLSQLSDRRLEARLTGGPLDRDASILHREVKAVTYHELAVRERDGGFEATAILDI
jgi:SHS2 domain-containing protein